ncbi:rifamycin-inactivating phosphotransferase [Actinoplanes utahensis]|uniref:Phosphoenolpyruvate synthase n=1 Tax=Actinoplanes utahensis TaxID=1869 RepID=A0A0A6UGA6_ACTUT|nr:rifamycin-inactivating phosphotransferase [Actinoplanes utahensis]KHD74496.1 phosphoenolpyruvate synthase [Actinoplanes utahensis]
MIKRYVLEFPEIDETLVALAGGKGANLGALARLGDVRVPDGFCVTTAAFRRVAAEARIEDLLVRLDADVATISAEIRRAIEAVPVPAEVAAQITGALRDTGGAYAVRSSATAEDLPSASFAGQQDSYLNVTGPAEILRHVSRCWASLFTERAVIYRRRHGIDHRTVQMAVVVQRMAAAESSGVLFTADPVTGDRRIASVDAVHGLGEDLVSGLVTPDVFKVRDGAVVDRAVAAEKPALTDAQAIRLAALGRRIEAHFGRPQDIEWCLAGDEIAIVQSRPITTLFPVPEAPDGENRVYLSVGHQQMMTDAMRPLGHSMWALTAMVPMVEAGGRLWVDVTRRLAEPRGRTALLDMMGKSDPLFRNGLEELLERGDFPPAYAAGPEMPPAGGAPPPIASDPAIVTGLIERSEASLAALRRDIAGRTGPALFDFLREAFAEHRRVLSDPLSISAIMAGMNATWWLNEHLEEWLGETNAADTLALSVPGNITAEMGLDLLDVADVIRANPEAVAALRDGGTLGDLRGTEAGDAVAAYLDRYGMRCAGEIDITRPRWSEQPETLVPAILDNVRNFTPGAARHRFDQGRQRAEEKAREILERLRALPDGDRRAAETEETIERVRIFTGYREYPKYDIVNRYWIYKQALLAEAGRLVRAGVLAEPDDAFYLTFDEFHDAVRTHTVDRALIRRRKDDFRVYQGLTVPRVLTSDGEAIMGAFRRDGLPDGALPGVAVSAGTAEGRARVLHDLADADLEPGDILVTAYTDPSWTPLFVTVAGLVTEVGGQMSHGAVIAREYGLPAVVSVPGATRRIDDGRRIRVHGTTGYVELLD